MKKPHPKAVIAPPWVFVSTPYAPRGLWYRCPLAILVPCKPHRHDGRYACHAEALEPCKGSHVGYRTYAHRGRVESLEAQGVEKVILRTLGVREGKEVG